MYRITVRDLDDDKIVMKGEFDAFALGASNKDETRGLAGFSGAEEMYVCEALRAAVKVVAIKVKENPSYLLGMALINELRENAGDESEDDDD